MQQDKKNQGFTLLEMSIVLVIIGFIVSGIMVGRSLIRQSQVNSVATDVQKYKSAFLAFQQKYGMLPGDFTNATTYWGNSGGSSGTNYTSDCYGTSTAGSSATCNGNGDGAVGGNTITTSPGTEEFLAWQHLSNAGMISGTFTGSTYLNPASTSCSTDICPKPGVNIPASSIDGAGFKVEYIGPNISDSSSFFMGNYGHIFFFGTSAGTNYNYLRDPVLSAVEAYSIDKKIDDGLPATGNIVTYPNGTWGTCATTNSHTTAVYNITATSNSHQCALAFITGF
jgi:prepilin-type N-terminal cleavage/methylation domain-containing protein